MNNILVIQMEKTKLKIYEYFKTRGFNPLLNKNICYKNNIQNYSSKKSPIFLYFSYLFLNNSRNEYLSILLNSSTTAAFRF